MGYILSNGELLLTLSIICGIISGAIGWSKHRSFIAWFFAGFLFSLVGVLISAVVSKNEKKCPKCGEFSPYGTTECEYCGYTFYEAEDRPKRVRPKEFIDEDE